MRILLSTYGSRGDVEPLAGLAVQLQALGAEVRVCAPSDQEFAALLARAGVPLAPAFKPVRHWVTEAWGKEKPSPADLPRRAAEVLAGQFDAIGTAADGCDALVATGLFPSAAATRLVAEQRDVPYVMAAYCPMFMPSHHHKPYAYQGRPHPPEVTDNRALWDLDIQTKNAIFGEAINRQRVMIGLPPVDNVRDYVFTDHPWLASDPILSPWQSTDLRDVVQTGAWILPDERPLPADLQSFLGAGPPPVYVGFGSMPMQSLQDATRAAVEAIRAQGRRTLVSHGWADLSPTDDRDDCFALGDVNHQALFRRVAAVVHHGGAGTTTAAASAGAPQVVVPQIADQPYWAGRIAALGIGSAHNGPTPTVESLSAALRTALTPETRTRAATVAGTIRTDGAAAAAKLLLDKVIRRGQQASA